MNKGHKLGDEWVKHLLINNEPRNRIIIFEYNRSTNFLSLKGLEYIQFLEKTQIQAATLCMHNYSRANVSQFLHWISLEFGFNKLQFAN